MSLDPYSIPAFDFKNKLARLAWWLVYTIFFKFSPRTFFGWRRFLLRLFGAKIGHRSAIYPGVSIWAPWNLQCEDMVAIANGVEIYNPCMVILKSHSIVSQGAYLCGATHLYNEPTFPLVSKSICIGRYGWVCARAIVLPGVTVNDGAVLGAGSVTSRDLDEWFVYAGNPAVKIKKREHVNDRT